MFPAGTLSDYLLVLSEPDPVAAAVGARWPTGEPTGSHVDSAPIRRLADGVLVLRRPVLHIHDEHLDRKLPAALRAAHVPMIFPSRHASERAVRCFTVHPLGNLGVAEVGGTPGTLNPTAPRLMTSALRRLYEAGSSMGLPATFEATHHGPALETGSLFAEIGYAEDPAPTAEAVRALAGILLELAVDPLDHVAVGIGGGHYAPHFTDLARKRRWAFGHILSRHALPMSTPELLAAARALTPDCEGFLFHRAEDARNGPARVLAPQLTDGHAPKRGAGERTGTTTSREGGSDRGAGT